MKKRTSAFFVLSTSLLFSSIVSADTHSPRGGNDNGHIQAWYDSSISSYGYTSHFDHAVSTWNGRNANVSISKTLNNSGQVDRYYVGTTTELGLYGRNLWYNDLGISVDPDWFSWSRSVVSVYDNQLRNHNNGVNFTSTRIRHTTAHEVGHSLGLAHTTSSTQVSTSLMTEGNNPSLNRDINTPSSYDISELRSLYGGPALMALSLNTDTSNQNEINVETQYESYATLSELSNYSDVIVIASPTDDFENRKHIATFYDTGDLQDYYTLNNLSIKKVLAGDSSNIGENLEVIESNSIVEFGARKIKMINDGYKETQKGQEYILFLKKDPQGQYQIVNRNEGTFTLDEVNSAITNKPETFITRDNNVRDNLLNEIANTYSNEL
ncbi:matrixin family metalloprotease [Paenibacillus jilunlii]|uniref:Matrixin n=2 Tax=Paenibacillus jilunlii TaxID=682956 RepID=A0A1G9PJ21_9BACL|nr:matrixin family metalloprotease [Paenibacillus jilunlii]SDL98714.1 Matrixin [Paenibacillus jilunlii]